jgi:hypothetical protein
MTALLEAAAALWDWLIVPVGTREEDGAVRFVRQMVERLSH